MVEFPQEVMSKIISYLIKPDPDPRNCLETVPQLKSKLREMSLKVGGKKLDLIRRLLRAGCWARRPYWDNVANAKLWGMTTACPRPLLTFDTNVHSKEEWVRTSQASIEEGRRTGELLLASPVGSVKEADAEWFEEKLRSLVGYFWNIGSMHSRYLNEMDGARRKTDVSLSSGSDTSDDEESTDSYHPTELFYVFDKMRTVWALTHKIRDKHGLPATYGMWDLRAASLRD